MALRDKKLSLKAKGLYAYLLTLTEDWDLHISELVTHATDGEKGTRGAMGELVANGYVKIVMRKDGGRFAGNDYLIFEDKIPHSLEPYAEKGDTVDGSLINTNEIVSTKRDKKDIYVTLLNYRKPIEVLNNMTGRAFKTDNVSSLTLIRARVKDGSPIEEICNVVEFICKKRMGTDYEMFLRPDTIFNRTKYESYLQEYRYRLNGTMDKMVGIMKDLN